MVENSDPVLIRVLNYDDTERRRWLGRLAKRDEPLIVVDAVFDEEVQHDLLGTIAAGTVSKEYYWLDRWFNVFRFNERFYCNVTQPPSFDGSVLQGQNDIQLQLQHLAAGMYHLSGTTDKGLTTTVKFVKQ